MFIVLGAFLFGWLIRSIVEVPPRLLKAGDKYVLSFALPVLVASRMSRITVDAAIVVPVVLAWSIMAICAIAVILAGRLLDWDARVVGALLCVGVLGNTSFLGLGLVEGLLGSDHLASALAYDQLGTFLALATYGSFIASRFGAGQWGWRPIVTRLVRFMPFVALVASVPIRFASLGDQWYSVADAIGKTVAPVAMCVLGLRFTLRIPRTALGPAVTGLVIKMALTPAILLIVIAVSGHRGDSAWSASLLQCAMPPMVTAGVVAVGAGLDEEVTTFMVAVGTLLAFVTVPLLSLAVT